jgi:hypothetical protein
MPGKSDFVALTLLSFFCFSSSRFDAHVRFVATQATRSHLTRETDEYSDF